MQGHICITASRMQIWPCMATAQVANLAKIDRYTSASANPDVKGEVESMPGISQVIFNMGIEQGIEQGIERR